MFSKDVKKRIYISSSPQNTHVWRKISAMTFSARRRILSSKLTFRGKRKWNSGLSSLIRGSSPRMQLLRDRQSMQKLDSLGRNTFLGSWRNSTRSRSEICRGELSGADRSYEGTRFRKHLPDTDCEYVSCHRNEQKFFLFTTGAAGQKRTK